MSKKLQDKWDSEIERDAANGKLKASYERLKKEALQNDAPPPTRGEILTAKLLDALAGNGQPHRSTVWRSRKRLIAHLQKHEPAKKDLISKLKTSAKAGHKKGWRKGGNEWKFLCRVCGEISVPYTVKSVKSGHACGVCRSSKVSPVAAQS